MPPQLPKSAVRGERADHGGHTPHADRHRCQHRRPITERGTQRGVDERSRHRTDQRANSHLPQGNSERAESIRGQRIRQPRDEALTDHRPQPASFDQRVDTIGPRSPQQSPRTVPACPTAKQARGDSGTHRRAQRHEHAQYRTEQQPAARRQDRARHEDRSEDGRQHDVGQRRRRPRRRDRAPHVLDVDHVPDRQQVEHHRQEKSEHGEPHDMASSGRRCSVFVHDDRDSSVRAAVSRPTSMHHDAVMFKSRCAYYHRSA